MTRNNLTWWSQGTVWAFAGRWVVCQPVMGSSVKVLWSKSVTLFINVQDMRNRCMLGPSSRFSIVRKAMFFDLWITLYSLCGCAVHTKNGSSSSMPHQVFEHLLFPDLNRWGINYVSFVLVDIEGFSEPLFVRNVHTQCKMGLQETNCGGKNKLAYLLKRNKNNTLIKSDLFISVHFCREMSVLLLW